MSRDIRPAETVAVWALEDWVGAMQVSILCLERSLCPVAPSDPLCSSWPLSAPTGLSG